jgi:hypothetical protein
MLYLTEKSLIDVLFRDCSCSERQYYSHPAYAAVLCYDSGYLMRRDQGYGKHN